eukprot:TRINITY_DN70623_c0_g1_i1.p1 TRINITY_DN70623_c0_g1~~TRINITY_DN70623_c0_g1_i1.p1  ORF type:complete len:447 (-),score=78.00 TRINITY_DN70623_c0_g1_i1:70-1338(-)
MPATPSLPSRSVPSSVMRMMAPRVANKPKAQAVKATGAPGGSATAAAATPSPQLKSCEFPVTVDTSYNTFLGLDVDWSDGQTLHVKCIMSGAVDAWNRSHPLLAIHKGDRIVAVNHCQGDVNAMMNEIKAGGVLRMLVRSLRQQQPQALFVPPPEPAMPQLIMPQAQPAASKKRPTSSGDSLYSSMPAPDPEKEKSARERAKESDIFAEAPVQEDPALAIFLDIDGVLRKLENRSSISIDGETLPLELAACNRALAPEALRALKYIVHLTGACIVLSSEWRRSQTLLEEAQTTLRALGLPSFRGTTPVLQPREELIVGTMIDPDKEGTSRLRWAERRAREITEYVRENREVKRWVALDDLDLSMADEPSVRQEDTFQMALALVRVDPETGLTLSHARKAREILLEGKRPQAASERPKKQARA